MHKKLLIFFMLVVSAQLRSEEFSDDVSIRKDLSMPGQNQVNPNPILSLQNFGTFGSSVLEFRGEAGVKAAAIEQVDNGQWGQVLRFNVNMPNLGLENPLSLSYWGLHTKNIYPYAGDGGGLFDESVYPTKVRATFLPSFIGTDGAAMGAKGAVPAPTPTDAGKCLKANGGWGDCASGLTSKGQLATQGDNGYAVLDVGPDQSMLTADSSTATGLRWAKLRDYTEHFIPTASLHGNDCAIGPGIYIKGNTPTCGSGTGGAGSSYAWAGIDFPEGVTSCINYQAHVPRKWDESTVEARMVYSRTTPGTTAGDVRFTIKSSFLSDAGGTNSNLSAPVFNEESIPDILPLRPQHIKMTGTWRNVNMTGSAKGRLGIFQLCREGGSPLDTANAPVRVYEIYMNWPISVGFTN